MDKVETVDVAPVDPGPDARLRHDRGSPGTGGSTNDIERARASRQPFALRNAISDEMTIRRAA